ASVAGTGSGDGTTSAIAGSHGAWTITQAMGAAAGTVVFIMDDGKYNQASALTPVNSGTTGAGLIVFAGLDNQNGANNNGGRPIIDFLNNVVTGFNAGAVNGIMIENLEIKRANVGISVTTGSMVYNCLVHDHASDGVQLAGSSVILMCD